jgi:hypothetical protein
VYLYSIISAMTLPLMYYPLASEKSTDQERSSPASSPNPAREGFAQGSASNAFATSLAAGEKYAITSQCKRPSDSERVNTAIARGFPAALNACRNTSSIAVDSMEAIIPSPRLIEYQDSILFSTPNELFYRLSHYLLNFLE